MRDMYVTEAPLKEETIPCIEPIAVLILANLIIAVYEALICTIKTDAVFNWIDSQIVWRSIQGDSRCFKQFAVSEDSKSRLEHHNGDVFLSKLLWSTVSKALDKSINIQQ